jgi:hypothetical protein
MHITGVLMRACESASVYARATVFGVVMCTRLRAVPAHVALVSSCAHVNVRMLYACVSAVGLLTYTCGIAGSYTLNQACASVVICCANATVQCCMQV